MPTMNGYRPIKFFYIFENAIRTRINVSGQSISRKSVYGQSVSKPLLFEFRKTIYILHVGYRTENTISNFGLKIALLENKSKIRIRGYSDMENMVI